MDLGYGRTLPRALCFMVGAIGYLIFSSAAFAAGTQYFINNQRDSNCSDGGQHTQAHPWCSFAPINHVRILSPGDQVLLARGGTWDEQLTLGGSGTPSEPITSSAYGQGPKPKIIRDQKTSDLCVLLTDASYWNIEHLEVGNASTGILLHYSELFHAGISIDDIYAHDNKGIWSGYSREFPVAGAQQDPFAAALNINLSAGILFNISSGLTFSSSQYVLKGVSVSNVNGSHNLDSVAFDAEGGTTDGQDGHNAFQDVVLNGLILTDDDGHVLSEYQSAGLGCSDSLRLIGMMNVTVLDSVLYDEAACHTSSGTAAVILGRVHNVSIVNNILFGVPSTGSPDETGIDLEFSESEVDLRGNLFAENAGAGVEILNIHPSDHVTDINVVDNSFLNNARAIPGAASVWQQSAGSAYGGPSGSIEDSLYSESTGSFFLGNESGLLTQLNNLPTSAFPSYAAEQFSSAQGANDWRYMYESAPSRWSDMPFYVPVDYNGAWEVGPAQYVNAFALAPASCSAGCFTGGVARVWVAPRDGMVTVRGRVLKSDARGGTGVFAEVNLVSAKGVARLWPAFGLRQYIAGGDQSGYATDVSNILVHAGDMIRFEVDANGRNLYDTVSWTPSVAYISAPRPRIGSGSPSLPGPVPVLKGLPTRLFR